MVLNNRKSGVLNIIKVFLMNLENILLFPDKILDSWLLSFNKDSTILILSEFSENINIFLSLYCFII